MADQLTLRIEGDGTGQGTTVYVLDKDGQELGKLVGVSSVHLGVDASRRIPIVSIELASRGAEFDLRSPVQTYGRPAGG